MCSAAILTSSVTNARIFRNALGKIGFDPLKTFGSAGEFIAHVQAERPALLVVQKRLITSGNQHLLELLREDLQRTQPVLVTGYQFSKDEAIELIRNGASELLLLPFTPETLTEKIGNMDMRNSPASQEDA